MCLRKKIQNSKEIVFNNKLNLRVTEGLYGFVKCFFSKRFSRQTRRDLRTW